MSLNDIMLGSGAQAREIAIQPNIIMLALAHFSQRNPSPLLVNPPVSDSAMTNARPTQVNRNVQVGYSSPVPVVLQNGSAPTSWNNAPGRGR